MEFVQGYEKVTSIFGRWPSFHDPKVHLLAMEWVDHRFDLRLRIHTWETTRETDERGYHLSHKHTMVELLFGDCLDVRIGGELAVLNILHSLVLELGPGEDRPVQVILEGIGGLEGSFRCRSVSVIGAEPAAR